MLSSKKGFIKPIFSLIIITALHLFPNLGISSSKEYLAYQEWECEAPSPVKTNVIERINQENSEKLNNLERSKSEDIDRVPRNWAPDKY